MQINNPQPKPFGQQDLGSDVTVEKQPRKLRMFYATDVELDTLCNAGNIKTLDVGLLSLTIGIFATIAITLAVTDIASDRVYSVLWAVMIATFLLAALFTCRVVVSWRGSSRLLADIKKRESE